MVFNIWKGIFPNYYGFILIVTSHNDIMVHFTLGKRKNKKKNNKNKNKNKNKMNAICFYLFFNPQRKEKFVLVFLSNTSSSILQV